MICLRRNAKTLMIAAVALLMATPAFSETWRCEMDPKGGALRHAMPLWLEFTIDAGTGRVRILSSTLEGGSLFGEVSRETPSLYVIIWKSEPLKFRHGKGLDRIANAKISVNRANGSARMNMTNRYNSHGRAEGTCAVG